MKVAGDSRLQHFLQHRNSWIFSTQTRPGLKQVSGLWYCGIGKAEVTKRIEKVANCEMCCF